MSAKEYFDSAPGQPFHSPDSFYPVAPSSSPPPLHVLPSDPISQQAYHSVHPPSPTKPLPVPPPETVPVPPPQTVPVPPPLSSPKRHQYSHHNGYNGHLHSPTPASPVTETSDDSLNRVPSHITSQLRPGSRSTDHNNNNNNNSNRNNSRNGNNDTISHTSTVSYSNNSNNHGPSRRRHRRREKELVTYNKETLLQLLIRQEYEADESKRLLHLAVSKLQVSAQRLAEADLHRQALETERKRLMDERLTLNVKVTEAVMHAQQQAAVAQQELALVKLKLRHAEDEVDRAKSVVRAVEDERDEAERAAARARESARRIREDTAVREAREQGRREGFDEGMKQGRFLGITQGGGGSVNVVPRRITHAGEPPAAAATTTSTNARAGGSAGGSNDNSNPPANGTSIVGDGAAFIEDVSENTTAEGRDPNASSSTESRSQSQSQGQGQSRDRRSLESSARGKRVSRAEFEGALQRIREDEGNRLQREMETLLNQERERLRNNVLLEDRKREEAFQAEIQKVQELERQRSRERVEERQQLVLLQAEKDREKELRLREQGERERERQQRERERMLEIQDRDRERERAEREREKERKAARERERDRDRAVAAAAAAAVSAARSISDSGSASDTGSRPGAMAPVPPLPYLPMPPPPNMPTPITMPEPSVRPSRSSTAQPNLPSTVPARTKHKRRASLDSQSTTSTMTGISQFDILTFPPVGRTNSTVSTRTAGGGGNGISGTGSRVPSVSRNGAYTRPHMSNNMTRGGPDVLSDIPEDASIRALSSPDSHAPVMPVPPSSSSQQQQPPSWFVNPPPDLSRTAGPPPPPVPTVPVPNIRVDVEGWRTGESSGHQNRDREHEHGGQRYMPAVPAPMNMDYLNPQYQPRDSELRRSDSFNSSRPSVRSNSSYEFVVEPPSHPSSPMSGGQDQTPHLLSPMHAALPVPPVQTQRDPRGNGTGTGVRTGGGGRTVPTEPTRSSPPNNGGAGTQAFPLGFVPLTFTPNSAPAAALPAEEPLPPGFVPRAITDTITGVTTPLAGASALPSVGGGTGGGVGGGGGGGVGNGGVGGGGNSGPNSRRQSLYGNPNAGDDQEENRDGGVFGIGSGGGGGGGARSGGRFSPYMSSSPLLNEPPVIPKAAFEDVSLSGSARTPGQRPRSIYGNGTPGGSTRNLPGAASGGGTPGGGGVYQNPLRREEEEEGEEEVETLVERNTRINATAPLPVTASKAPKKKKRSGR